MALCGALIAGCASSGVQPLGVARAHDDFALAVATIESGYVDPVSIEALLADAVEGMYRFTGMARRTDVELLAHADDSLPPPDLADPLLRFTLTYGYLMNHYPPPVVNHATGAEPDGDGAGGSSDHVDIGVTLAHDGEWIRIASVAIDSVAERAGLNRGDGIMAIDGRSTSGMSLSWCYQQLSGAAGSIVEVRVNTEEGAVVDVRIVRSRLYLPTVVRLYAPWQMG